MLTRIEQLVRLLILICHFSTDFSLSSSISHPKLCNFRFDEKSKILSIFQIDNTYFTFFIRFLNILAGIGKFVNLKKMYNVGRKNLEN